MGKVYHTIRESSKQILKEEINTVFKNFGGRIKIALAYPNTYYVGMSNLGFQNIYFHLNTRNDVVCERVFMPDREQYRVYQECNFPLLTLESGSFVNQFDIIAFSCSFESDYPNILDILKLSNIPVYSKDRGERSPLVILGGVCSFFNPEPVSDFIDLFLCGEGETLCDEFIEIYKTNYQNREKNQLLKELATLKGIYIPAFYHYSYDNEGKISSIKNNSLSPERIKRRVEKDIDKFDTQTRIFSPNTEFGHMYLLELARGCPRGCRFCILCQVNKPFRIRDKERLLNLVKKGITYRPKIGLISASVSDYPYLNELCSDIIKLGGKVSVSSLRLDSITENLLEHLLKSGHQTITLAPETARERLRKSIGKKISDEQFMDVISLIIKMGIPNLKLYFMIGLPGETIEDIEEIVSLVKKIMHFSIAYRKGSRNFKQITVSVNAFIPKPLTSFQRLPMENTDQLTYKIKFLTKKIRGLRGINIIYSLPKWAYIQCLLSRGDRRVGNLLYNYHKFDKNWKKAFYNSNLNPDFYIYRYINKDEILPWNLWL